MYVRRHRKEVPPSENLTYLSHQKTNAPQSHNQTLGQRVAAKKKQRMPETDGQTKTEARSCSLVESLDTCIHEYDSGGTQPFGWCRTYPH